MSMEFVTDLTLRAAQLGLQQEWAAQLGLQQEWAPGIFPGR